MTFMRKFDTLLHKSNGNLCKIDSQEDNDGVVQTDQTTKGFSMTLDPTDKPVPSTEEPAAVSDESAAPAPAIPLPPITEEVANESETAAQVEPIEAEVVSEPPADVPVEVIEPEPATYEAPKAENTNVSPFLNLFLKSHNTKGIDVPAVLPYFSMFISTLSSLRPILLAVAAIILRLA